jgi:hypothetical protein
LPYLPILIEVFKVLISHVFLRFGVKEQKFLDPGAGEAQETCFSVGLLAELKTRSLSRPELEA